MYPFISKEKRLIIGTSQTAMDLIYITPENEIVQFQIAITDYYVTIMNNWKQEKRRNMLL